MISGLTIFDQLESLLSILTMGSGFTFSPRMRDKAAAGVVPKVLFKQMDPACPANRVASPPSAIIWCIQWPFQEPIDWRYLPYIRPI